MNSKDLRISFMGTPEIAVESLKNLFEKGYNIVNVVTVPDKPAGRGLRIHESAVKKYAIANSLKIYQPNKLKNIEFLNNLKSDKPDIIVVVAFRMLPQEVIDIPLKGCFNLHASLLPQYRGAAPINWAIINGEKETGVTTFFLNNKIDEGNIILSCKVDLTPEMTASDLHDVLMKIGAEEVVATIELISSGEFKTINQIEVSNDGVILKKAPKLFKDKCNIDWERTNIEVGCFINGLSNYPGAYTHLVSPEGVKYRIKILKQESCVDLSKKNTHGDIATDGKEFLRIFCGSGCINIKELQLDGKKVLPIREFLKGFKINNEWIARRIL